MPYYCIYSVFIELEQFGQCAEQYCGVYCCIHQQKGTKGFFLNSNSEHLFDRVWIAKQIPYLIYSLFRMR